MLELSQIIASFALAYFMIPLFIVIHETIHALFINLCNQKVLIFQIGSKGKLLFAKKINGCWFALRKDFFKGGMNRIRRNVDSPIQLAFIMLTPFAFHILVVFFSFLYMITSEHVLLEILFSAIMLTNLFMAFFSYVGDVKSFSKMIDVGLVYKL